MGIRCENSEISGCLPEKEVKFQGVSLTKFLKMQRVHNALQHIRLRYESILGFYF
jgi:hypothetical protein